MGTANSDGSQERGEAVRGPAYALYGVKPNGANIEGMSPKNCKCIVASNSHKNSVSCAHLLPFY